MTPPSADTRVGNGLLSLGFGMVEEVGSGIISLQRMILKIAVGLLGKEKDVTWVFGKLATVGAELIFASRISYRRLRRS